VQQLHKVAGKQISGINTKVRHGPNGKMFLLGTICLEILYIKECVDKQPGIKNTDQVDGIHNGMKVMLGVVIGLIGIGVIN
jgi:hypothetical protein